jgi:DNA-binding SARP family transcriptional activator
VLFRVLGPLEVVGPDGPVPVNGIKRRATLGFLLMHANRVVATSRLVHGLWPVDDAPKSARKILQNAIWGLRGTIGVADPTGGAALVTQPPGYMLRLDPAQVDLYRFHQLMAEGQADLAAGTPESAARRLREALALWHGPALADLVEVGICWPELTAIQNARLDAMEVYFDAELACGRHHAVLADLEAMVEAEPLREGSCGQFMLALYRCGRQADALGVYSRVRSALVEDLGLEPGRALQTLQQQILTHDPALTLQPPQSPVSEGRVVAVAGRQSGAAAPSAQPADAARRVETRPLFVIAQQRDPVPQQRPHHVGAEHRDLAALMLRVELPQSVDQAAPAQADEAVETAAALVRDAVESFGGAVTTSIGQVSLALFGLDPGRPASAEDAVRAALAVRHAVMNGTGRTGPANMHAAVSTGRALVRHRLVEPGSPAVTGELVNRCQNLLSHVPAGDIWVCDATRGASRTSIGYLAVENIPAWRVRAGRRAHVGPRPVPIVDREHELDLLRGVFDHTAHRAVPHLFTVFGDAGVGKTRFAMEFERRVAATRDTTSARFAVCRIPPPSDGEHASSLGDLVRTLCAAEAGEVPARVRAKLAATARRITRSEEQARWLVSRLSPLVGVAAEVLPAAAGDDASDAVRLMLAGTAAEAPLALVVDDLHNADDTLLDFVGSLLDVVGAVPLLVVVAARPQLLDRRPAWGGGQRHSTVITLEPLSDDAIDRVVELVVAGRGAEVREPAGPLRLQPEIVA